MTDNSDLTLEILKRLQADLALVRQAQGEHTARFDHLDEQLEAMAGYVTFSMGKSAENRADIELIMAEMKDLKARIEALETRRS